MRINTNVASINAQRNLGITNKSIQDSMAKLSSGFRINRAGDDAAGLGIANKLRADTRAMSAASKNAEQANSLLSIAEGATGTVQKILERMKELATQAASDNTDQGGRDKIQAEFNSLRTEIGRIVSTTQFQGKTLLDGTFGASVDSASTALAAGTGLYAAKISGTAAGTYTLTQAADGEITLDNGAGVTQTITGVAAGRGSVSFSSFGITLELDSNFDETTAAGTLDGTTITVAAGSGGGSFMVSSSGNYALNDRVGLSSLDVSLATYSNGGAGATQLRLNGLDLSLAPTAAAGSNQALTSIDEAITRLSTVIGDIGAAQNRIDYAIDNVKTSIQNFSAAESTIRDLDMAEEMSKFSKNQILQQAGTAMLAQANQSAQGILQLLRG